MLPHDHRAAVLNHDAALDSLAVKLYGSADGRRAAELHRKLRSTRTRLRRAMGGHSIAPGDLRR
jgi:hypothetical protein